ncbi:hypothetical protein COLO4_37014 [Corchorus olitorius]|uniref:Uncharacterized protein n=1 Tax=Corchorus olitorius TaxID=93759 RepID=A0A1R3G3S5_9ROSI|nr:hypothetical protein COLO4_37014 [Corchorus olitorius]
MMPMEKDQIPQPPQLKPFLKSIIQLLEVHLAISYPSATLEDSPEIDHHPILKTMINIIISLAEQHPHCGPSGTQILKNWLGITHETFPTTTDAFTMLESNEVLSELYSRGIIHQSPPQLVVELSQEISNFVTSNQRITCFKIPGENRQMILLTTAPAYRIWIKAKFSIQLPDHNSIHKLKFLADTTLTKFPDINTVSYKQYCFRQTYSTTRPLKIMIFNAAGATNPEFIYSFTANCFEKKPDLAIITETRLSGTKGVCSRQTMGFQATASIEPQGFFGGIWFLWNDVSFTFRILTTHDNCLSAQLTMYDGNIL